jgi:peptidoglycan/xylan/chitin deacetylase (PgdA/CDA1 family)
VLRALPADGHEIESHTVSHVRLPKLADEPLAREMSASRDRIREMLGRDAPSLPSVHSPAMLRDDQQDGGGLEFESFPERPLDDAERSLERLLARGELVVEAASADDLKRARVPASAGPVYLALARRYRAVTLAVAEVRIDLHAGTLAEDELGGWRLQTEPDDIDLRLAAPKGGELATDLVYDATWSPHGSGAVVRHSTIVHFLVRAAAGDE